MREQFIRQSEFPEVLIRKIPMHGGFALLQTHVGFTGEQRVPIRILDNLSRRPLLKNSEHSLCLTGIETDCDGVSLRRACLGSNLDWYRRKPNQLEDERQPAAESHSGSPADGTKQHHYEFPRFDPRAISHAFAYFHET